jgi:hypothetical protein
MALAFKKPFSPTIIKQTPNKKYHCTAVSFDLPLPFPILQRHQSKGGAWQPINLSRSSICWGESLYDFQIHLRPFSVIIPISFIRDSDCLPIHSQSEPLINADSTDFSDFSGY